MILMQVAEVSAEAAALSSYLIPGGSPTWAVVSVSDSEAAHELGEATR